MIDFEKIRTIYKLGRNLKLSDIQLILNAAKSKSFAPNEYLIKEGALKKEVFFIRTGLVRAFIINDKGDEITTMLRWENQVIASPEIILFDQASRIYIEALEPTNTLSIDYDQLQSIMANNPKLEANRKFFLQNLMKQLLQRIDSFVLLSPEERYLAFVANNPDIINRAPNKYIANILGITPVSLSRIRKRISTKKGKK